jgi:hypothetical protein
MLVLQGLIPRRTTSYRGLIYSISKPCGGSDPTEDSPVGYQISGTTFNYEYLCEFETELKNT